MPVNNEQEWVKSYLSSLVGGMIIGVEAHVDEGDHQVWPVLIVKKGYDEYRVEVSQDPEGNGPGFLFGLPAVDHTTSGTAGRAT